MEGCLGSENSGMANRQEWIFWQRFLEIWEFNKFMLSAVRLAVCLHLKCDTPTPLLSRLTWKICPLKTINSTLIYRRHIKTCTHTFFNNGEPVSNLWLPSSPDSIRHKALHTYPLHPDRESLYIHTYHLVVLCRQNMVLALIARSTCIIHYRKMFKLLLQKVPEFLHQLSLKFARICFDKYHKVEGVFIFFPLSLLVCLPLLCYSTLQDVFVLCPLF